MPVKIVLDGDGADPFFLGIRSALRARGAHVVQADVYDDQNLFITRNPKLTGPHVIYVPPVSIAPIRFLAHPLLRTTYDADAVPYPAAKAYFDKLRADYVTGDRAAASDLPQNAVVVYVTDPDQAPRMIKDVTATAHPVIVAAQGNRLAGLRDSFPDATFYDGPLADLFHKAVALVSYDGAGVALAQIHRCPTVVYTPGPADHLSQLVTSAQPFDLALKAARAATGGYAKYLFWSLETQGFRADAPDFADRLCAALARVGYDAQRLGLDVNPRFARALIATQDAAATLTDLLAAQPGVQSIKLTKALKVSPKAWVFKAKLNGEKVVIKRFFEGDPRHTVNSLKGELDQIGPLLGAGPYQVNRCIDAWPDAGAVALSFVKGKRMVDVISKAKPDKRAKLFQKAGGWLNAYAAPRNRQSTFGPRFWLKQLDAQVPAKMSARDHALFQTARQALLDLTPRVIGTPVTQAAAHGDFAGINVLYHKGVVTGVDIQGTCWIALAKDAATFVGWQALFDPPKGARRFGVGLADYDAFFAGLPLLADEHATIVPFFIGWQATKWFLEGAGAGRDCHKERMFLNAYLTDVEPL